MASRLPSGLVMEGRFSFAIEKIRDLPNSSEMLVIDKENEKLLRTSAVWQEPVEVEEPDHVSLELRRQDLKISLLLDLVGELLIRQSEFPAQESIRLTATAMEFPEEIPTRGDGEKAKATLYLIPAFPRALQFYGDIAPSEREGFSLLIFQGTSIAVRDQLEKIIFTNHRRSIAQEHAGARTTDA
ncbi:MAG: hypothetical protein WDZ52_07415 [Pseudohongiellaceae bacterium]